MSDTDEGPRLSFMEVLAKLTSLRSRRTASVTAGWSLRASTRRRCGCIGRITSEFVEKAIGPRASMPQDRLVRRCSGWRQVPRSWVWARDPRRPSQVTRQGPRPDRSTEHRPDRGRTRHSQRRPVGCRPRLLRCGSSERLNVNGGAIALGHPSSALPAPVCPRHPGRTP